MAKFQKVFVITVREGDQNQTRIYDSSKIFLGRSPDADITLVDSGISRYHLEISMRHGRLWVMDLGSANGSILNGEKLVPHKQIEYKAGDLLQLGINRIEVSAVLMEKAFNIEDLKTPYLPDTEQEALKNLIQAAHAEAIRLQQTTKEQSDRMLKTVEEKGIIKLNEANAKAQDIIASAQLEAEKIHHQAMKEHSETVLRAQKDAESAVHNVFHQAELHRQESETLAQKIIQEASQKSESLVQKAEQDAIHLSEKARAEILKLRQDWEEEKNSSRSELELQIRSQEQALILAKEESHRRAQEHAEQIIRAAENKKEEIVNMGQLLYSEAETAAHDYALNIRAKAETELILAQKKSQQIHQEILEYEDSQKKKIQLECDNLLIKTEQEAQAEKHIILEKAQTEAAELILSAKAQIERELRLKQNELENEFNLKKSKSEQEYAERIKYFEEEVQTQRKSISQEKSETLEKARSIAQKMTEEAQVFSKQQREEVLKFKASLEKQNLDSQKLIEELSEKIKELNNEKSLLSEKVTELLLQSETLAQKINQEEQKLKHLIDTVNSTKMELQSSELETKNLMAQRKLLLEQIDELKRQSSAEIEKLNQQAQVQKDLILKEVEQLRIKSQKEFEENKLMNEQSIEDIRQEGLSKIRQLKFLISQNVAQGISQVLTLKSPQKTKEEFQQLISNQELSDLIKSEIERNIVELEKNPSRNIIKNKNIVWGFAALSSLVIAGLVWSKSHWNMIGFEESAQEYASQQQELRNKRYIPEQTDLWFENYTDRVLKTKQYQEFYQDESRQEAWLRELQGFLFNQLKIDEDKYVKIVAKEAALVKQLGEMKDTLHPDTYKSGIEKMRELESQILPDLILLFGGKDKYIEFQKFTEAYFQKHHIKSEN